MALFPVFDDAVQINIGTPAAEDQFSNGVRLVVDGSAVYGATAGGEQVQNGLLLDANGAVIYIDATAGLPAGVVWVNGMPFSSAGALCISNGSVDEWVNGLPFASNGALVVSIASAGSAATWNPANKTTNLTLSGGDLIATRNGGSSAAAVLGTTGISNGKAYFEMAMSNAGNDFLGMRLITNDAPNSADPNFGTAVSLRADGTIFAPGCTSGTSVGTWTTGTVIMVALDMDSKKVWIGKNGAWAPGADPTTGTNPTGSAIPSGTFTAYAGQANSSSIRSTTLRVSTADFSYTPPTGYGLLP